MVRDPESGRYSATVAERVAVPEGIAAGSPLQDTLFSLDECDSQG
jgi:hypothetical protein